MAPGSPRWRDDRTRDCNTENASGSCRPFVDTLLSARLVLKVPPRASRANRHSLLVHRKLWQRGSAPTSLTPVAGRRLTASGCGCRRKTAGLSLSGAGRRDVNGSRCPTKASQSDGREWACIRGAYPPAARVRAHLPRRRPDPWPVHDSVRSAEWRDGTAVRRCGDTKNRRRCRTQSRQTPVARGVQAQQVGRRP